MIPPWGVNRKPVIGAEVVVQALGAQVNASRYILDFSLLLEPLKRIVDLSFIKTGLLFQGSDTNTLPASSDDLLDGTDRRSLFYSRGRRGIFSVASLLQVYAEYLGQV